MGLTVVLIYKVLKVAEERFSGYLITGQIIRISVCWDFEPLKVGSTPYRLGQY